MVKLEFNLFELRWPLVCLSEVFIGKGRKNLEGNPFISFKKWRFKCKLYNNHSFYQSSCTSGEHRKNPSINDVEFLRKSEEWQIATERIFVFCFLSIIQYKEGPSAVQSLTNNLSSFLCWIWTTNIQLTSNIVCFVLI